MANKTFNGVKISVIHLDLSLDANRQSLTSGENISHSLGKIARWYKDISWVGHKHDGGDITSGVVGRSYLPTASTNDSGIVKLYNGVDSTSTTLAATANSVKTAYELANSKSTVSISDTLTSGSDIGTITINGVSTTLKAPSGGTSTDENVKQTPTTTNADYELLFSYTADNTTRTEGVRKSNLLTFNPNGHFRIYDIYGDSALYFQCTPESSTTTGKACLTLGNNTASYGELRLYGSSAYRVNLLTSTLAATRTLYLPNKNGTLAITNDIPAITQVLTSGTKIATVTLGSTTTDLYAPSGGTSTDENVKQQIITDQNDHNLLFSETPNSALTFTEGAGKSTGLLYNPANNELKLKTDGAPNIILSSQSSLAYIQIGKFSGGEGEIILTKSGYGIYLQPETLTKSRDIYIPNKDGTIALTSDVPNISVTQTLTSGTEIGRITINNTETVMYAPSGGTSTDENVKQTEASSVTSYRGILLAHSNNTSEETSGVYKTSKLKFDPYHSVISLDDKFFKYNTSVAANELVMISGASAFFHLKNTSAADNEGDYGTSFMELGNDEDNTSTDNAYGSIKIYSKGQYGVTLLTNDSITADRTLKLPNKSGVLATTDDISGDTKVEQKEVSTNTNFELLLSKSATTSTEIDYVNKSSKFTFNPATSSLKVYNSNGQVGVSINCLTSTSYNDESNVTIGNNIAEGTAGSSYGVLRMYGSRTNCVYILPTVLTADRVINLPNKSGIIALTSDIPTISVTQTLTSGTEIGSISINGSSTKLYAPNIVTPDNDKVKQEQTESNNVNYQVLLSYTNSTSTDNSNYSRKSSKLTFNPDRGILNISNGKVQASSFEITDSSVGTVFTTQTVGTAEVSRSFTWILNYMPGPSKSIDQPMIARFNKPTDNQSFIVINPQVVEYPEDSTAESDRGWGGNFGLVVGYDSLKFNGTTIEITDAKVAQTATTTNANYKVLFSYTADNTSRTEGVRKSNGLTFNPSTQNLMNGKSFWKPEEFATYDNTNNKSSSTIKIWTRGTTDVVGVAGICVGNAEIGKTDGTGTAGNFRGNIRIYDNQTRYVDLRSGDGLTASRTLYIPNTSGKSTSGKVVLRMNCDSCVASTETGQTEIDYNSYILTGFYEIWTGSGHKETLNAPDGNNKDNNFYLIVQARDASYVSQIAVSVRDSKIIYTRNLKGGVWQSWVRMGNDSITYCTCTTAAATAAKIINVPAGSSWMLRVGAMITVKFSATNTASNPTFDVRWNDDNTTPRPKSVYLNSAVITTSNLGYAGSTGMLLTYVYDGTYWVFVAKSQDSNSDTKVTQTEVTANNAYNLLFSSSTATTTTKTETSGKSAKLTFNPSTGVLTVSSGNVQAKTFEITDSSNGTVYTTQTYGGSTASNSFTWHLNNYTPASGKAVDYPAIVRFNKPTNNQSFIVINPQPVEYTTGSTAESVRGWGGNFGLVVGYDSLKFNGTTIKITDTTYTASGGIKLSGTTFSHSNSVTAVTTAGLYKVKYDAQGHITGTSSVAAADLPSHTHSYIPLSGSDSVTGRIKSSASFVSTSSNAFRACNGGYGVIFRNDGSTFNLLLTDKKTDGSEIDGNNWNDLRPFAVTLSSGLVTILTRVIFSTGQMAIRNSKGDDVIIIQNTANGTAGSTGQAYIMIGNAKPTSSDGNAQGYLRLYDSTGRYANISTNTIPEATPSIQIKIPSTGGTLALTSQIYDASTSRTANTVLAAPNGSAGAASFRKLVDADLPTSGVTAGSYGPSANASPGHGGSFYVPYITFDNKGRATSASTKTITLPSQFYNVKWSTNKVLISNGTTAIAAGVTVAKYTSVIFYVSQYSAPTSAGAYCTTIEVPLNLGVNAASSVTTFIGEGFIATTSLFKVVLTVTITSTTTLSVSGKLYKFNGTTFSTTAESGASGASGVLYSWAAWGVYNPNY